MKIGHVQKRLKIRLTGPRQHFNTKCLKKIIQNKNYTIYFKKKSVKSLLNKKIFLLVIKTLKFLESLHFENILENDSGKKMVFEKKKIVKCKYFEHLIFKSKKVGRVNE